MQYPVIFLAAPLAAAFACGFPAASAFPDDFSVLGLVTDERGGAISGAMVTIAGVSPPASTRTDPQGRFRFADLAPGPYRLEVRCDGFEPVSLPLSAAATKREEVLVALRVAAIASEVTVTAARGLPQDILGVPHGISVIDLGQAVTRRTPLLPLALREEAGIQLQQTSAHQGAVLIRGLTGQQVLHLIDGVRYNNSIFRPGPNQYLALIDPEFIERLEVARGPNSAQYGSDSMGGTVNLIPPGPPAGHGRRRVRGQFAPGFRSADLSAGGALRLSLGDEAFYLIGGASFRRSQDLRTGRAVDSHSAVTRFLGLPSGFLGGRLQDTAFAQRGGYARVGWKPGAGQALSVAFHHGNQQGGRRYDQLNGGNGNLIHFFSPQSLDFFYARYEKLRAGPLDSLGFTLSFNRQVDGRRFQGGSGNPSAAVQQDRSAASVIGYQVQGTTHFGRRHIMVFGGEAYDEHIDSEATSLDPVSSVSAPSRGRFPDGSRYANYGAFLQHSSQWYSDRMRTQTAVRLSGARFHSGAVSDPVAGIMKVSARLHDVTFQCGLSYRLFDRMTLFGSAARGFRAPNVTDYASVGFTSNGFEVPSVEAARSGAFIGSRADSAAENTGSPARELRPETLRSLEGGMRFHGRRTFASISLFQYDLEDFIARRALILPSGAVGRTVGGATIVRQLISGAVITMADPRVVLTRANVGAVRIRGWEAEGRVRLAGAWLLGGNASYLRGTDRAAQGPPDLEGGLPPLHGVLSLRWQPALRPFSIEVLGSWSDKQGRLSSLEMEDQRIGAVRTRSSIAAFFRNGAAARGLVGGGILLPTGETLGEVQDRVLGRGVESAPLFSKTPGFAAFSLRGVWRTGEQSEIIWAIENVMDRNYRLHGSGIDAPGRNLQIGYVFRF